MTAHKSLTLGSVELKFTQKGTFEGYASTFGGVDSYDDTIMAGAYKSVIEEINAGTSRMPKMFVNHSSWDIPVGKWTKMYEDSKGLMMEGELTKGNPQAEMIRAALDHGTVDGLSIGFRIGDYEMVEKPEKVIRVIKSIKELPEVSIVTFPADDSARVDLSSVKSRLEELENVRDLEDFLREVGGFSHSLAKATVGRSKRLFTLSESDVEPVELPNSLKQMIALNLLKSRTE
jgi:HK97 family phage prohead protease